MSTTPMTTRKFFGFVSCQTVADLSSIQRSNLVGFKTRQEQIVAFEAHDCDWIETDVAPYAVIEIAVKVGDVLQHNPTEGVWIYGASVLDIARVKSILGGRVRTGHGTRVEGWR